MPEVNDMADVVDVIEAELKEIIDDEEKRLLDDKALLLLVYKESTGDDFVDKTAVALTTSFTTSFIDDFVPEMSAAIEVQE